MAWALISILPGWLVSPHGKERRDVAAVYLALAAELRSIGSDQFVGRRRALTAALNTAYDTLLTARSTDVGQNRERTRLGASYPRGAPWPGVRPGLARRAQRAAQAGARQADEAFDVGTLSRVFTIRLMIPARRARLRTWRRLRLALGYGALPTGLWPTCTPNSSAPCPSRPP